MRIGGVIIILLFMALGIATPSPTIKSWLFDQYGNISWKDEKVRLDNVAVEMRNRPNVSADIMAYGGRRGCPMEAQDRASRAKNYLMNKRGIEFNRVIWRDGGYREDLTVEIYLIPREVEAPLFNPTIQPSEVEVRKNCKRRNKS